MPAPSSSSRPARRAKLAEALAEAPDPGRCPAAPPSSEAMALAELGFEVAEVLPGRRVGRGGLAEGASRARCRSLTFCPTGGIDLANAPAYLALPNVPCVGGTWVAPAKAIADGDFAAIERLAREASALRR